MKGVLIFVTGAVIGSVVTWKLVEKIYRDLAEEEISSAKETFNKKRAEHKKNKYNKKEIDTDITETEGIINNGEIVNYSGIVKSEQYESDDDNCTVNLEDKEGHTIPYVIEPEEFGIIEHYGTKTLTYYADNVLTDEIDKPIKNRNIMIGPDALNHFGEYEDDAVHVRDIDNEMDYEILKTEKLFSGIKRDND